MGRNLHHVSARARGLDFWLAFRALPGQALRVHAVVIDRIDGDPVQLAQRAAKVLGSTAYDMRAPMSTQGGGPAVVRVLAQAEAAEAARASLSDAGFDAHVVPVKQARPRMMVRNFSFGSNGLQVEARGGERRELPYPAVRLLIRAHAVQQLSETETKKTKKLSVGRALMTGGLSVRKTKETTRTVRSTQSDELLFVYPGAGDPLLLTQHELAYRGLGDQVQASQLLNFNHTVQVLRERCPHAKYDERLRRLAFQNQMLGRTLQAEQYLEFAVALVEQSLARRI